MRRLSAIALLGILLSFVTLPVLLAQAAGSTLPACCRTHGVHHCALPSSGAGSQLTAQHCAAFPAMQTSLAPVTRALLSAGLLFFFALCAIQSLASRRLTPIAARFQRSLDTRGPPALFA